MTTCVWASVTSMATERATAVISPTMAASTIRKATWRKAAASAAAPIGFFTAFVTPLTIRPSSTMPSRGSRPWTNDNTTLTIVQPGEMRKTRRRVGPKRKAPLMLNRVSSSLSSRLPP